MGGGMGGGEEEFDVLDAEGRPTGRVKARSAVHRDGDWHAAVHVWVLLQCPCAGRAPPPAGAERLSDFTPAALLERALRGGGGTGRGEGGGSAADVAPAGGTGSFCSNAGRCTKSRGRGCGTYRQRDMWRQGDQRSRLLSGSSGRSWGCGSPGAPFSRSSPTGSDFGESSTGSRSSTTSSTTSSSYLSCRQRPIKLRSLEKLCGCRRPRSQR